MAWTLQAGAVSKTFAEWGLSELRRHLVSQAADMVTFKHDGADFDSDLLFAYGTAITIFRDGVKWFQGVSVTTPRAGSGTAESINYRLEGPWWYLTKLVYQQPWVFLTNPSPKQTAASFIANLLMNIGSAGQKLGTKDQLTAILQYAIARGAQLQIGTISTDVQVPVREVRDLTCAQAILEQLRFLPDAVIWFDYATTPPTIHIRRGSELTAKSLDLASETVLSDSLQITSREDLQIPSCVIHYIQTNEADGVTYNVRTLDSYPANATGLELNALVATLGLKGSASTTTKATILVQPSEYLSGAQADSLTWLQKHAPWLNDTRLTQPANPAGPPVVTLPFVTVDPLQGNQTFAVYANEVAEGTIPSWAPINYAVVEVRAEVKYDKYDNVVPGSADATASLKNFPHPITIRYLSTDAPVGWQTYSTLASFDPAEPVPYGLAQYLYDALSALTHDGSITTAEEELSGTVGMGNKLNILNGRAAWSTMASRIQGIEEDVERGTTTIKFGYANQLGPQDLLEWLRGLRPVARQTSFKAVTDGLSVGAGGEVSLPKFVARNDTTGGPPLGSGQDYRPTPGTAQPNAKIDATAAALANATQPEKFGVEVFHPTLQTRSNLSHDRSYLMDETNQRGLKLLTAECVDDKGHPHILRVRQMAVCDNNVVRYVLVVASEIYDKPV